MEQQVTPEPAEPPANHSVLGRLKRRRTEIAEGLTKDIPIPRWEEPELFIRVKPIGQPVLDRGFQMVQKAKAADRGEASVNSNCDVLIAATLGVYAKDGDKEVSLHLDGPDMEATGFDEDLARALEMDFSMRTPTARQIVRELFFTDGDIMTVSNQIVEWSGYSNPTSIQALLGE